MSGRSPAPWTVAPAGTIRADKDRQDYQIAGADGRYVASVDGRDPVRQGSPHNKANAQAIAAVPELIAAAQAVIAHRQRDFLDNTIEPYVGLVAALALASGRGDR